MKQTAVEWLVEQICGDHTSEWQEQINQAKEMEKQQMFEYIKKNYVNGENSLKFHTEEFKQYYNKTFKKTEQ